MAVHWKTFFSTLEKFLLCTPGKDVRLQVMSRYYGFWLGKSENIITKKIKYMGFELKYLTIRLEGCHHFFCDMYLCCGSQKWYVCRL